MQWSDDQEEHARIFKKYTAVRICFLNANPVRLLEILKWNCRCRQYWTQNITFILRAHEFDDVNCRFET